MYADYIILHRIPWIQSQSKLPKDVEYVNINIKNTKTCTLSLKPSHMTIKEYTVATHKAIYRHMSCFIDSSATLNCAFSFTRHLSSEGKVLKIVITA
jgi:hypothetical protein